MKTKMHFQAGMIVFSLCMLLQVTAGSVEDLRSQDWPGPENRQTGFTTYEEIEDFLLEAKVVRARELDTGVTRPYKMLLERDGIRMNAVFRYVDVFKHRWDTPEGMKLNFRDYHLFEVAAYRLSRLLGIENVPPTVMREWTASDFVDASLFRKLPETSGSLQVWVENARTEKRRIEENAAYPDAIRWMRQLQLMFLFDNLIYNDDRNQGNILIGPDWTIWFIDATRAFRALSHLKSPKALAVCERGVWLRLQEISDDELRAALTDVLRPNEIKTLLKRRDLIVQHFSELVERKGSERVFYDLERRFP